MKKISQIPFVKKLWAFLREKKILKKHQQVADFWNPIIKDYEKGKIEKYSFKAKKELPDNKIIWQYWGQGFDADKLPEVVKICLESVNKYRNDYIIVRLSDDNVSDYLDLPDFVLNKKENGSAFNRTFFSDLLRIALLKTYGGVWLDATVLLTGNLPEYFTEQDYFVYQRDSNEHHKSHWESSYAYYWGWNPDFKVRMLNSIFFSKKESVMISTLLDLMLYYWKTQNEIIDYFFFQILYDQLINGMLINEKCSVISDTIPHIIQTKLNGECNYITYEEAIKQSNIHKLTYKNIDIEMFKKIMKEKMHIDAN
ncbi:capsular polysaccharide synthesis protein [Elizabethkingia meningoseptica]|uniref:capsular polysaccharide synthesis protein n=1 Tax=Elizabethkingia meningoseptica TaxID=238 RepID=UPI0008420928|nr:capsular polysaccharide synthesis protein [Elizabethkingia meningoseptica]ODM54958.1 capsular biosynthesis protein [Elizabethkingia meningoseptica]OHT30165.1 capsular biosynthesis protein [Elizabethkingia meningoseptica]OPC11837.1 capsular biosynthesis protein [Elizabethkingia meningoseptica]